MKSLSTITDRHPELLTHVGTSLKIENQPHMVLCIESIGSGPRGLPALSVAHYGEQNGDLLADPEMCFEMEIENGVVKEFHPYYFRQDYLGFEQFSVVYHGHDCDNKPRYNIDLLMMGGQREFAVLWDKNLADQGYLAVTGYDFKR